jgi:hypothetical protein
MSGYTSKKLITERHADPVTMDHIIELRKENERLRQHLRYQEHRDGRIGTHSHDCYGYGPSHYECALREIERLREALGTISATESIADINPSVDVKMMWIGCVHIARAALKEGE